MAGSASYQNLREMAKSRDALHPVRRHEARAAFAGLAEEEAGILNRSDPLRESLSRRLMASPSPSNASAATSGRKRWGAQPRPSDVARSPSGGFLAKAAAAAARASPSRKAWQSEVDLSGRRATMPEHASWSRHHRPAASPHRPPPRTNGLPLCVPQPYLTRRRMGGVTTTAASFLYIVAALTARSVGLISELTALSPTMQGRSR